MSVRQLASAFAVNPGTVVKAYDRLRAEGIVATNAKSGTFIAADRDTAISTPPLRAEFTDRLTTLLGEGRARGLGDTELRNMCARVLDTFTSPQKNSENS